MFRKVSKQEAASQRAKEVKRQADILKNLDAAAETAKNEASRDEALTNAVKFMKRNLERAEPDMDLSTWIPGGILLASAL